MDDQAHVGDESLLQELVHMPFGERECIGIVLVSQLSTCVKCGGSYFFILTSQVTYFYTLNLMVHYPQYSTVSIVLERSAVWYNTMAITRTVQWDSFTMTKNE